MDVFDMFLSFNTFKNGGERIIGHATVFDNEGAD
jgi:hypothetical protein